MDGEGEVRFFGLSREGGMVLEGLEEDGVGG